MSSQRPIIIVRKKKSGGHGHHGGAWKVAYADFVTAMMALFMVMWLLAATDENSRSEIANYFRSGVLPEGYLAMGKAAQVQPSVLEQTGKPPPAQSMVERQAKTLRDEISQMAAADPAIAEIAGQVAVSITDDGALIEAIDKDGKESMLFDVASVSLKPALIDFLTRLAPVLSRAAGRIEIIGHTDARPFKGKDARDNWSLSFQRADAARRVLERAGVPAEMIHGVMGRADSELHDPTSPLAASNRRLGILIRPDASDLAAAPEGAAAPEAARPPGAAPAADLPTRRDAARVRRAHDDAAHH